MRDHAAQVRRHLTKLGEKGYWKQVAESTPEFVVAFLPGEIFFSAALEHDPELIEFGAGQGVILATPTTLIALMKAVAAGWRDHQVTESAEQIRQLGVEMHDRIRKFIEHYDDMGKGLSRAVTAYQKGRASLESRLLSTARRFEQLGAGKGDELQLPLPVDAPNAFSDPD